MSPVRASTANRKLHRWGALIAALPLLVVIPTGLLLQLKKESDWIQPPTRRGAAGGPRISFEAILAAARGVPEARVAGWDDVDRLDVRPERGVAKVRAKSRYQVQVDTATGEVLEVACRRSDLIESLHDGSFFGDWVKLGVFLPVAVVLLGLCVTGVYLWWLPHGVRRRKLKERKEAQGGAPR